MKWIVRGVAALVGLALLVFGGAWLAGTHERPVAARLAGYHADTLRVSHRDVPLPLHIWYPAIQGGTPELLGQNALFYGEHVLRDAMPAPGTAPVVVLSHGSGGNAVGIGWIASELALRGMIVIAANHPGTTSRDSEPARTVEVWERPEDMTALLDLLAEAPPLGLEPDMTRVAALGFSLGGFSALSLAGVRVSKQKFIDYCAANAGKDDCGWMQAAGVDFDAIDTTRYEQSNRDPRIGVAAAVDPALPLAVPEGGTDGVSAAVMIVNLGAPGDVPAAMRADGLAARIPNAVYANVPGARHFSFLAECSALGKVVIGLAGDDNICSDRHLRNRGEIHAELRGIVGGFLADRLGVAAQN